MDIVIGTHRLLSKDVQFRKLGLLIIDEEHRFGVKDKEKIKKLRTGIDVLTLTATPIPRTLQLSLLGIRDLSVISSPPRQRRSVKTFVAKVDDLVIKEAVTRELQRGGQVFVVHNRVQSIQEMAHRIQELRPEARVAVAHGQMPGRTLEEIMFRFVQREIDVLVCTTIIESGLDIPNANTIIITRADRLGLAEIYQLRGRVGRSSEQAYAYLLVPSLEGLSGDAQQRLRALMDYNELGGGFKLAMSDLQIRGGGNILGESQSGTIAAVGYDLYLELLQQTVEDLKRERNGEGPPPDEELEPEINLRLPAFLPEYLHPRYRPALPGLPADHLLPQRRGPGGHARGTARPFRGATRGGGKPPGGDRPQRRSEAGTHQSPGARGQHPGLLLPRQDAGTPAVVRDRGAGGVGPAGTVHPAARVRGRRAEVEAADPRLRSSARRDGTEHQLLVQL